MINIIAFQDRVPLRGKKRMAASISGYTQPRVSGSRAQSARGSSSDRRLAGSAHAPSARARA